MAQKQELNWNYSEDKLQRWARRPDGSVTTESVPQGESLTQQQYIQDCDVNIIMATYMKTGMIPQHVAPLLEGDFSKLPDYQEALHTVMRAEEMFMEIPATVRQRFDNNPQQLMDYLQDPKNLEESYKLGLRTKPPEPQIDPSIEILKSISENTKPK